MLGMYLVLMSSTGHLCQDLLSPNLILCLRARIIYSGIFSKRPTWHGIRVSFKRDFPWGDTCLKFSTHPSRCKNQEAMEGKTLFQEIALQVATRIIKDGYFTKFVTQL